MKIGAEKNTGGASTGRMTVMNPETDVVPCKIHNLLLQAYSAVKRPVFNFAINTGRKAYSYLKLCSGSVLYVLVVGFQRS